MKPLRRRVSIRPSGSKPTTSKAGEREPKGPLQDRDWRTYVSTAVIIPCRSTAQKARGSSPRTPRYNGRTASAGVATAASLRIAEQMSAVVCEKVSDGWRASRMRYSPVSRPTCRSQSLMGWKAGPESAAGEKREVSHAPQQVHECCGERGGGDGPGLSFEAGDSKPRVDAQRRTASTSSSVR